MKTYFYEIRTDSGQLITALESRQANNSDELLIDLDLDYNLTESLGDGNWKVFVSDASEELLNLKLSASLQEEKDKAYIKIDAKTEEIIARGFEFDGHTFSLSIPAQMNWSEMHSNKDLLIFPMSISTINSNQYSLVYDKIESFWAAGATVTQTRVQEGAAIKKLIHDSVSKSEVKDIEDNRI